MRRLLKYKKGEKGGKIELEEEIGEQSNIIKNKFFYKRFLVMKKNGSTVSERVKTNETLRA